MLIYTLLSINHLYKLTVSQYHFVIIECYINSLGNAYWIIDYFISHWFYHIKTPFYTKTIFLYTSSLVIKRRLLSNSCNFIYILPFYISHSLEAINSAYTINVSAIAKKPLHTKLKPLCSPHFKCLLCFTFAEKSVFTNSPKFIAWCFAPYAHTIFFQKNCGDSITAHQHFSVT